LTEPVGKNTAACIAYAATYVRATIGDAVLAVLPADHFVRDEDMFRKILLAGMDFVAESGVLLTIGITPDRPATGFGYIKQGPLEKTVQGFDFYRVGTFTEKPSVELANAYLSSGDYLWNAGIFVFKASSILREIESYLADMAALFRKCAPCFGTPDEEECVADCYSRVEEISIDFGVMEKTRAACVVPAEIGWDDVGSWDSFASYMEKDTQGNFVRGQHVSIGSRDCIVYSDQVTIATLGLSDITVVASQDAVLVMKREKGEEVKDLVDLIEKEGLTDLL
jgi:mannose-1-phosphate guanylyltransferase